MFKAKNNNNPPNAEAVQSEIRRLMAERLGDQLKARDKIKAKIENFQRQAAEFRQRAGTIEGEIQALEAKVEEALGAGKDPGSLGKELRLKRLEMADMKAYARKIERESLSAAKKELEAQLQALSHPARACFGEVCARLREEYIARLREARAIEEAWGGAAGLWASEFGLPPIHGPQPRFVFGFNNPLGRDL